MPDTIAPILAPAAWIRSAGQRPSLCVVIPMHNEVGAATALIGEVAAILRPLGQFEIVVVDDASDDGTAEALSAAQSRFPELRLVRHRVRQGQSRAVWTGVNETRARLVATIDGDGQNDPADIPRLAAIMAAGGGRLGLVAGHRFVRRDSGVRRWSSRIANAVRRFILGDGVADSACGLKLFRRDAFMGLPCFDHMHRFLPALMSAAGWQVAIAPVGHRPRLTGRSKYGTLDRLWVGIVDLLGVAWLMRRTFAADPDDRPRP